MNSLAWLRSLCFAASSLVLAACGLGAAAELPRKFTETIRGTGKAKGRAASFEMVLIPGGTFLMGSPRDEKGRRPDEGPQHEVQISPFYLCTTETTFELFDLYLSECGVARWSSPCGDFIPDRYLKVLASDPAMPRNAARINNLAVRQIYSADAVRRATFRVWGADLGWGKGKRPVMQVTWFTAVNFCRRASRKTGKRYRLPTEAEWEYACRAGSKTAYAFGDEPSKLGEYAWFEDNADEQTHRVAQKKPNAWGLYDMHGNVMEWCHDFCGPKAYSSRAEKAPVKNPLGPRLPVGKDAELKEWHQRYHVARGGSWQDPPQKLRSAARGREKPSWRYKDPQYPKSLWWLPEQGHIGFRVACEADGVVKEGQRSP